LSKILWKFGSFGKEFRWTKFNAVEGVTTCRQLFLEFCAIIFPEWPLNFEGITIHQVIWPSLSFAYMAKTDKAAQVQTGAKMSVAKMNLQNAI